jgi:hypothetical protein
MPTNNTGRRAPETARPSPTIPRRDARVAESSGLANANLALRIAFAELLVEEVSPDGSGDICQRRLGSLEPYDPKANAGTLIV